MNNNQLHIVFASSIEEAPVYGEEVIPISLDKCIIVANGTVNGNPTVDFQFTGPDGTQYLTMLNASIVEALASAIRGSVARSAEKSNVVH